MAESCILSKLVNNRFTIPFSCNFIGVTIESRAKIDTGAELSLLPLRSVVFHTLSGVSSSAKDSFYSLVEEKIYDGKNRVRIKTAESGNTPTYVYRTKVTDIEFDAFTYGSGILGVSCDLAGNILIGMDILQNFDFHVGHSRINTNEGYIHKGDIVFIGCPYHKINESYLRMLNQYLEYLPERKLMHLLILNNKIDENSEFVKFNYADL